MNRRDIIFSEKDECVEKFVFNESVANVFPDMIKRSVPGYVNLISLIGVIGSHFAQDNTNIYDLGCSLGAASASFLSCFQSENCTLYAVDNSESMLSHCKEHLTGFIDKINLKISPSDIRDIDINNASVVIMNFTLQFLPLEDRLDMIRNIYLGLNPGGVLILSEKILPDNKIDTELQTILHHQFKRANGYSELEIAGKRSALENVLIAESLKTHFERLKHAGFEYIHHWQKCLNFSSILAIKDDIKAK